MGECTMCIYVLPIYSQMIYIHSFLRNHNAILQILPYTKSYYTNVYQCVQYTKSYYTNVYQYVLYTKYYYTKYG